MLKSILDHNADALAALAKTEDPGARHYRGHYQSCWRL